MRISFHEREGMACCMCYMACSRTVRRYNLRSAFAREIGKVSGVSLPVRIASCTVAMPSQRP